VVGARSRGVLENGITPWRRRFWWTVTHAESDVAFRGSTRTVRPVHQGPKRDLDAARKKAGSVEQVRGRTCTCHACPVRGRLGLPAMTQPSPIPTAPDMITPLLVAIRNSLEIDREVDGRWIAEAPSLPGVLAYGNTQDEAANAAVALALHTLADRLEHAR
jgi:predicted RNase H-like HicB family nuclease